MNTYHMRYFIDAVAHQSLRASAALNHVTHSAVSLAIRTLEKELGVELLVHSKRRFEVTRAGEKVRAQFEEWLRGLEDLKVDLTSSSDVPSGSLRIIAAQSLMTTLINDSLVSFRALYPGVRVSVVPATAGQALRSILAQESDIGILVDNHLLKGCSTRVLSRGRFVLARRASAKSQLEDGIIVTSPDKVEVVHLSKLLAKSKKALKVDMEVMSWTLIKSLVMKTNAIGYLPDYLIRDELESKKLIALPLPGKAFDYEIKSAWKESRPLHRNARLFLETMTAP